MKIEDLEKVLQYFVIAVPESEEQAKAYFWARKALSSLRPVSREQVEKVWRSYWITVRNTKGEQWSKCCNCQNELDGLEDGFSFCPFCGSPMTDEAVQMVMERLEALKDG